MMAVPAPVFATVRAPHAPRPRPSLDAVNLVSHALDSGRVFLEYQRVVASLPPGATVFHEALARVRDGSGRTVSAGAFIDAVEHLPLGRRLDRRALELAFAALHENHALRIAVNLSVLSLEDRDWVAALERGVAETPDLSGRLILELTERSVMEAPARVARFMAHWRENGVMFALDDFGAGCTAFCHLRNLSFDIIKIDGQFTQGIEDDADNQVLLRALVDIGRHFGTTTVAERVERPGEARILAAIGVDCLQGYLFGAPGALPLGGELRALHG